MLTPYEGGLFVSPAALELTLSYCSHKCAYCFANLQTPDRKFAPGPTVNLLTQFRNRDTFAARLLQQGYAALMSNRVDPFAVSNYRQSLPLIELMVTQGVPIMFQTRGGPGVQDAIKMVPRSAWYISICHADDAIRKRIEPGSPSIQSRLDLAESLLAAGHHVDVGLNPLVEDWMPHPEKMLDTLFRIGVRHVTVSALELDGRSITRMSDSERKAVGPEVLAEAKDRVGGIAFTERALSYARSTGMHAWRFPDNQPSNYYDAYSAIYPKTMPLAQDYLNHCFSSLAPGALINANHFLDFMLPRLPPSPACCEIMQYGRCSSRAKVKDRLPMKCTWDQLLRIVWDTPSHKLNPMKSKSFALVSGLDNMEVQDGDGLPLMAFLGNPGTEELYVPLEGLAC